MRNEYQPEPGDTVRATLGDNVLYGKAVQVFTNGKVSLLLDSPTFSYPYVLATDWTFEPWTRPVTFKPLAVVRLDEEYVEFDHSEHLIRTHGSHGGGWYAFENHGEVEYADAQVQEWLSAGRAELVFEGVD